MSSDVPPIRTTPPSPARVATIRRTIAELDGACVFAEPQLSASLLETVTEGTGAEVAELDPLGSMLPAGAGLYPRLLRQLTADLVACLEHGAS